MTVVTTVIECDSSDGDRSDSDNDSNEKLTAGSLTPGQAEEVE